MTTALLVASLFVAQLGDEASDPAPEDVVQPEIETTNSPAFQIGLGLRCPVCQGMPIAESPSQMAQDMMVKVREMVADGKSKAEIYDYFAERYGEWVLLEPKAKGFNLGLWILPVLALLLGGFLVWRFVSKSSRLPDAPVSRLRTRSFSALACGSLAFRF